MSHEGSPQRGVRGSPVRKQSPKHTAKNRRVVLVEETLLSTKHQATPQRSSTGSIPRLALESPHSPHRSSASVAPSASSRSLLGHSPMTSPRSSVSSLLDVSSLVMTPSSEDHILEELRMQIASSARRIHELEREVKRIPGLQDQIDELHKERSKLANGLQDQQEVAKSLKQRMAMLQEQNSQLGKLLQSQQGGSEEAIAMRNTIMASLAQLKQLQEQVNTIPSLKKHVNALEQERERLSQEATSSPSRAGDHQSLLEENSRLKATNEKLVEEMKVVGAQLTSVSQSCDGLKHRMEAFESAQARSTKLRERVKRLEAEKDALYHEIIDLKFHQRRSQDMDSAELSKQMATLQKANVQMRNKMEQTQHDARQQKEQLVLKLFEIEALNVKTHKYELEKQVLQMEQLQAHSEFQPILRSANASPEPLEDPSATGDEDGAFSPESKIQMLKLEQLRIHNTQSRNVMQAVVAERDELERRVAELSTQVEERGIEELMEKMGATETRLSLAMSRNEQLEKELEAVLKSGGTAPSAAVEVDRLHMQLEKLQMECSTLAESNRRLEKKYSHQKEAAQGLEVVKEEKRKAERKYRESKEKLRALAKELACSVNLLKDYQDQCSTQHNELQQFKSEIKALREKYAATVTELEVSRAENHSGGSAAAVTVVLKDASTTLSRVDQTDTPREEAQAKEKAEQDLKEVKVKNETLSREVKNLHTALTRISESLSVAAAAKLELEKKLGSKEDSRALGAENTKLATENKEKEEELISKHEEILCLTKKVQTLEEQLSQRKGREGMESELGYVRQQIIAVNLENQSLCDQLQKREQQVTQLEQKIQKEMVQFMQKLEAQKCDIDTTSASLRSEANAKASLAEKIVDQEKVIQELQNEMNKLERQHTEVSAQYKESQVMCSTLQERLETLSAETSKQAEESTLSLQQEKQRMEQEKQRMEQEKQHLEQEKQHMEQKKQHLEQEKQHMEQKKQHLEQEKQHLEQEKQRMEQEKQHMQQKCLELEQKSLELEQSVHSANATIGDCEEALGLVNQELKKAQDSQRIQRKELENMQSRNQTLSNEVEGYRAMVDNLTRQIDEAETREMDHEVLRQKIRRLEAALSDSQLSQLKVDNQALLTMLQETVNELPNPTATEGSHSLREENLRLEQQVSVLSQWNDKQRQEIEKLETRLDELLSEKERMTVDLITREGHEEEVSQLRQELHEMELEVNALRRQVKPDLQEEMQIKVETQSQILAVFSEHNQRLQSQVEELQQQVRSLGGNLSREKAVSPPPFPDPINTTSLAESGRTLSEMSRENEILSQRLAIVEAQLSKMRKLSASARRRSSSVLAITSIPLVPIHDDVQIRCVNV